MNNGAKLNLGRSNKRISDVERRSYKTEQIIFREHELGDLAFIIAEGEVEIFQDTPNGSRILRRLKKGAMFGEMALIDDSPRMASARAIGRLEVLVINRIKFQKKLGTLDPFTQGLLNILADTARSLAKAEMPQ
ncbi:MAG: cyclic nucleotide-binding domain-containing protein [Pseudomonadota bacterium]|nr:cyclic nucleotide-binding domain-containing protein [Pseudomonadota bacterium]